ncbi:MAG: heme lyase NrfEFG subunit NrfE, partial [Proteobacteria bacterium]|nr:heme lyase NrfEFG subunit NrfE [Pseudomonadota bacterium]
VFEGARNVPGPNYTALRGTFRVLRGGREITVMEPETRTYSVPPMQTTEAAIKPVRLADLYAVVGDPDGNGGYATRLYHKPLLNWLWIGALIMVAGAFVSLTDRRHRVGAPARRRRRAGAAAPAPAPQDA